MAKKRKSQDVGTINSSAIDSSGRSVSVSISFALCVALLGVLAAVASSGATPAVSIIDEVKWSRPLENLAAVTLSKQDSPLLSSPLFGVMICYGIESSIEAIGVDYLIPPLRAPQDTVRCCDVDRRDAATLSEHDWETIYNARRPVVLTGAMRDWPAMHEWNASFFDREPWRSHKVMLSQHTAFDVCLKHVAIAKAVAGRHGLPNKKFPTPGYTLLRRGVEKTCDHFLHTQAAMRTDAQGVIARSGKGENITTEEREELLELYMEHLLPFRKVLKVPNRNRRTTLGEAVTRLSRSAPEDWGTYLFLESAVFESFPRLWEEYIHGKALTDFLSPVDFSPPPKEERNKQRSLLVGAAGSRTSLHMDPFGWTSWIGVISGRKAFRLWPPNATAAFYAADGPLRYGVDTTSIDAFNEVPEEAGDYHQGPAPLEVVVEPGEIMVTMDYWHQAHNLEASIAVTGNFVDRGNLRKVLLRAVDAGSVEMVAAILKAVKNKDPSLYRELDTWNLGLGNSRKAEDIWTEAMARVSH